MIVEVLKTVAAIGMFLAAFFSLLYLDDWLWLIKNYKVLSKGDKMPKGITYRFLVTARYNSLDDCEPFKTYSHDVQVDDNTEHSARRFIMYQYINNGWSVKSIHGGKVKSNTPREH